MTTICMKVAVGAVALALVGGFAIAQNIEEVTVQGTRVVTAKVVARPYDVPITEVGLSYGVSTRGLDLASQAGVMELKKRVNEVAETACKELGKRYPNAKPSDAECAKAAADEAMAKVNELAAKASKASGK